MATANNLNANKSTKQPSSSLSSDLPHQGPTTATTISQHQLQQPVETSSDKGPKFMHVSSAVIGSTVHLQTKEGTLWEGILASFTPDFAVCLDLAVQINPGLENRDCLYQAIKNGSKTREKAFFELKDIARLTVVDINLALPPQQQQQILQKGMENQPGEQNNSNVSNNELKDTNTLRHNPTPTTLVIIPQHSTSTTTASTIVTAATASETATTAAVPTAASTITTAATTATSSTPTSIPMISTKPGIISTKTVQIPTTLNVSASHISLPVSSSVAATSSSTATTSQSHTIQMQAPITAIVPNIVQVPMTAHQNSTINQAALVDRPPQTLPIVPITSQKPTAQTPTTLATSATHVALPTSLVTTTIATTTSGVAVRNQPHTIQMQAPVTTIVPNLVQVPITAHQNISLNQTTLINGPPQTLPVVPITTMPSPAIKQEPTRHACCLFDNGVRCDRVAGNASFNARIQKIVGTKKMNFALDRSAGHSYICDHHKAIITVAKKSTPLAREPKSNARNYTANNNANTPLAPQHTNNLGDIPIGQPTMQHQVNLEMLSNQSRLANNHSATVMSSMPMRPGTQIAYGHYPGPHTNQLAPMDTMMTANYDNTGGDNIPPNRSTGPGIDVDLQQLQVNTLRRYKRHFRVQTRPGLNKMQLAESLKHHFRTLPINEKEAITYFVYIVKCSRNKLDHNPKAD